MTNATGFARRAVLADRLRTHGLATDVALIAGGALFTAGMAQLQVPMWPVPITGQTLAVVLVGATLGARRGFLSLLLYAVAGLAGAPIFAEHTAVSRPSRRRASATSSASSSPRPSSDASPSTSGTARSAVQRSPSPSRARSRS